MSTRTFANSYSNNRTQFLAALTSINSYIIFYYVYASTFLCPFIQKHKHTSLIQSKSHIKYLYNMCKTLNFGRDTVSFLFFFWGEGLFACKNIPFGDHFLNVQHQQFTIILHIKISSPYLVHATADSLSRKCGTSQTLHHLNLFIYIPFPIRRMCEDKSPI